MTRTTDKPEMTVMRVVAGSCCLFKMARMSLRCGVILVFSFLLVLLCISLVCHADEVVVGEHDDDYVYEAGNQPTMQFGTAGPNPMRYMLFTVNPGEGFNLRRDVYLRVANLVKLLNKRHPWTLVLPPWGNLYHWKSNINQHRIPWGEFFDLPSLSKHVPVMEFADFLKDHGSIDKVYHLQRYKEGWTDGKWDEKMDERECLDQHGFHKDSAGRWRWRFWGYETAYAKDFTCLSLQKEYSQIVDFVDDHTNVTSLMLMRAEKLIHGHFSEWSQEFWTARRSMRYSKRLRDAADEFRATELDSNDVSDKTELVSDWREMNKEAGDATGGPYIAVHLRRQDYLHSHPSEVPNFENAASQIRAALDKTGLNTVFVATDAKQQDFNKLNAQLDGVKVVRFQQTREAIEKYKDGGIAIIDQWICAHARYFVGTSPSTFTFRINEDREILGFQPDMTFNCFCGDSKADCKQPTKWTIKY